MTDLDRWVHVEGPPPAEIRELLDLITPHVSPEQWARLDAKVYAAIAEDIRREERQRKLKRGAAIAAVAAAFLVGLGGAAWHAYHHPGILALPSVQISAETAGALVGKAQSALPR